MLSVFRPWDEAYVLHLDEHLAVVDKPAGMASQAADPELPDDVATRLSAFLAARGEPPRLGVHQRLDRETSGVIVLSRSKIGSRTLAAQFENRTVEKTYVACVTGWSHEREIVLRDFLGPMADGLIGVTQEGDRRGKLASTRVRALEQSGDRFLLELVLETGRTHQARVQLAHAGAPIAGDNLYGRTAAPRLLLHARSLAFTHPSGRAVSYEASVPPEFAKWLAHGDVGERIYDDASALQSALARAAERRYALAHSTDARRTTAFRLVNEEGDGLPGLAVDVYDDWLIAHLYGEKAFRERALDALQSLGARGVYLKVRPKQSNLLVDTRKEELAPKSAVRGEDAPDPLTVLEEGSPYFARLGDGLSTGLFLDQRANRKRVALASDGKRVLNLFSYTCGFSIAAALGGAASTTSVDVSAAALERGREGFLAAGIGLDARHVFAAEDVFSWLLRAKKKGATFDCVILDPPSYSSTKTRRFVAEHDYAKLAALALSVMPRGGEMLACTNHRGIRQTKFRKTLFDALRLAKRDAAQVKDVPPPLDFPHGPGREAHLKCVWVTLC